MTDKPSEGALRAAEQFTPTTSDLTNSQLREMEMLRAEIIDREAVAPAVRELVTRLDYLAKTSDQLDKCLVEFSDNVGCCGEYWEVWQEALIRAEKCAEKYRHLLDEPLDKAG